MPPAKKAAELPFTTFGDGFEVGLPEDDVTMPSAFEEDPPVSRPSRDESSHSRPAPPKHHVTEKSRKASSEPPEEKMVPIDLDEVFSVNRTMENEEDSTTGSLFEDGMEEDDDETPFDAVERVRYFNNPNSALLDNDASLIPGSPFSKPGNKTSSRPSEPLSLAKYASTLAMFITFGWVVALLYAAIWDNKSIGRVLVEVILALISFFGLFWNTYFIISSIAKCFIPAKAFKTNTKYCSIIPETKPPEVSWLNVTIQIPVYKESLQEVMIPTLKSCMKAREHYIENSQGAHCNIVICDDGMMAFLKNNFAAAEMLWDAVLKTRGRTVKLSKVLKTVPRASQNHLRGMRSKNVYEVFHRMLFYYHYNIGFVARSTVDRRGKFKKASNLNSHLQLALGAQQLAENEDIPFADALLKEAFNSDGSRQIMFGNNVKIGHLICVNDADARMAESVIIKTVPEFLNDPHLGFTQHATKTMTEQRGESYYTNLLSVYTDALYQGHFLLSSIMGCHPPLVGHSIFLRTEAVKQCGRMRMLRNAQRWLKNIGLQFLPVDQVGFSNLHANSKAEFWSESHVSEDFELMIHLYNLGFNGRYCAYPDCEFEEGITRTFDEEAGRHRKFALGAHELVFNPFQEMIGHGIFTPLFKTFISCDIPSYYKIFLTAYLCSYASGGTYLIVFSAAAIVHIIDAQDEIASLQYFSPAGVIVINIAAFYVIGYVTFLITLLRMHYINNKLLFPEYRKRCCGALYIIFVKIRYCLFFQVSCCSLEWSHEEYTDPHLLPSFTQFFFYTVASITYYFLGSMDHLLSRPNICGATNKDSILMSRCTAFYEMAKFNLGSWGIALFIGGLAYAVVAQDEGWKTDGVPDDLLQHILFSGPAVFLSVMCFVSPIILNPFVLGWPFFCRPRNTNNKDGIMEYEAAPQEKAEPPIEGRGKVIGLGAFMDASKELDNEMGRIQNRPDLELGTIRDLFSSDGSSPGPVHPAMVGRQSSATSSSSSQLQRIPEAYRTSKTTTPAPLLDDNLPTQAKSRRASSSKHAAGSKNRATKFDI